MHRPVLAALLGFALALPSLAQSPSAHPGEPLVIEHATTTVSMKADGTGEETESMVVTVGSEASAKQLSVLSAIYTKQSQRTNFVYVRVRHPDGTMVETPLTDVQDQAAPVTQQAPFYSDIMIKQLPVKGLRVGDTLEWQTHSERFAAEAPGQFWATENLVRGVVVEDQQIELRVPAGLKLTVRTKADPQLHLAESDAEGQHIYHWTWKQLDPTVGPQAEALKKKKALEPLSPAAEQDAKEGALADIAWTTFPNWAAVGAWYRELEGDRVQPDESVRKKVAELTAGKVTTEDKVQAVYGWVSGQIRYVGVALGLGRYQPHTAAAVLDNQYGDCKDKHTLLAAMLTSLGLEPEAALVGVGIRFDQQVPSPASFNHLITRVTVDGKPVWLDTTAEVAAYRVLVASVRDRDALLVPNAGAATVVRTPAELPFPASSSFAVKGSLDDAQASDSEITITHHDDAEVALRGALRQVSPAQYDEALQGLMEGYGFGGKVSQVEVEHVSEVSVPLVLRFHYHRDHNPDWGDKRITFAFGPTFLPTVDPNQPEQASLDLGGARTDLSTVELKLPPHWGAELPEAVHQHAQWAECDVTYGLANGTLTAERRIKVLEKTVRTADLKAYGKWYDSCGAGSVPYVQLTSDATASTAAASPASAKAQTLVQQANTDIRAQNYSKAQAELKQAQALDPHTPELWGDLGAVAMHQGEDKLAIELYSKEAKEHPESQFAYRNLAWLQSRAGDNPGALKTLEALQRRVPDDPTPAQEAVALLSAQEDNAGALKQAKYFSALLSEKARQQESFRFTLGAAELRGGEPDAGEILMAEIAKNSSDLNTRNNASYELAVAGRRLPEAEESQRKLLAELAAESGSWTGNESLTLLRQRSALITASWDTMGWILFQEGKPAEAEAWIRPALTIRGGEEPAEHLGDILVAEGKQEAAAEAYAAAQTSLPARLAQNAPRRLKLAAKLSASQAAAKLSTPPDGHLSLLKLRTWQLGPAEGLEGTATFQLLFSAHGVAQVSPVGSVTPQLQQRAEKATWSNFLPPGDTGQIRWEAALHCEPSGCGLVFQ